MFYYIRKKLVGKSKAVRDNGKILVFTNDTKAKEHIKNFSKKEYELKHTKFHPSNSRSSIYGKKYKVME